MFGDPQSPTKDRTGPGAFMSYACTELDKSLIDYARAHLNETEDGKKRALEEVREFIKKELDVHFEPEEVLLLCFLRSRKFDVKRTCSLMRRGAEFVESYKSLFDRVDSEVVRRTIASKVVGFLPYRDSKGRALLLVRSECWNPAELKAEDLIFGCLVSLYSAIENPVNQVAGFVVIVDFKNLSLQQVIGMSNWLIFGLQALQRCCPCLVKEFHIVHTPAIFRATWKIVKPLISEKIKKRITFYKSSRWDSLHRKIDPSILPEELGGQLGPYTQEHWAGDVAEMERKYYDKCRLFLNRLKTR